MEQQTNGKYEPREYEMKNDTKQNSINNNGNKPMKHFRAGQMQVTVWSNEGTTSEGKPTEYKTVSFERTYKDKNGDWKATSTLRVGDLPRAALILNKAYEFIALSNA